MNKRKLTCAVCGDSAGKWEQHWNRDTGWGVCVPCVLWLRESGASEIDISEDYGTEGINWGVEN